MHKILVIEDEHNVRETLCDILTVNGFEVITANNGKIGVQKAESEMPDMIISDVNMPEMQGFEVVKHIRSHKETQSIPIILLTAKSDISDLREGMSVGADDYLFKPFNVSELMMSINSRLGRVEAIREENQVEVESLSSERDIYKGINEDITSSIRYAEKIQKVFFPKSEEIASFVQDHFVFFKPRDIVSGDIFWWKKINGKMVIAAVDCTGHGVPGALLSIVACNMLEKIVGENVITKPSEILRMLNISFYELIHNADQGEIKDGMDISVCTIDKNKKTLEFSGAARPCIHVTTNDDGKPKLNFIKGDTLSITGIGIIGDFTNHKINYKNNDTLYLYSDGFTDQFGGEIDKKIGTKNLRDLIIEIQGDSMTEQHNRIDSFFAKWKGNYEQIDDVLLMGIKL